MIAFEDSSYSAAPPRPNRQHSKEDDNQHLDINTLKGDPNDGDE
ncbi:MAG: hypothetical protein ACLTYW_10760 [Collinsella sp.]